MTYNEAVEFIHSFINYEREVSWEYPEAFKLERMRAFAKECGNPQKSFESILIAGSKGKGSTAALLSSILRMDNYRVGLYTSPHLVDMRERIQVNGLFINEFRFIEMVCVLRKILEQASWRKSPPTFFEILTVLAFSYFKEMKVQIAVLEVGLGGLFDSTNIVEAKVVGLTPISLEHTDKLGKTLSKIAVQKCGIIKGRECVVSAPQADEVEVVIQKSATQKEAEVIWVGREIKVVERVAGENFQRFDLKTEFGNYYDLEIALLGLHQLENAALAVGLAKSLESKTRLKISDSAIRQGILDARWPGRLESIADHPKIILDGAQNADSAKRLMQAMTRHFEFEKMILVIGVMADKDLEGILQELLPFTHHVIATQSENPRALAAREIEESVKNSGKPVDRVEDVSEALDKAKTMASSNDLILVTGSLYLVGEIKALWIPSLR